MKMPEHPNEPEQRKIRIERDLQRAKVVAFNRRPF